MSKKRADTLFSSVGAVVMTVLLLCVVYAGVQFSNRLMNGVDSERGHSLPDIVVPFFPYAPSTTPQVATTTTTADTTSASIPSLTFGEVIESCGPEFTGECVRVRRGPGAEYATIASVRNGMVLRVAATVTADDGTQWHKVIFDEWLRYPERLGGDWYIAAPYLRLIEDEGLVELTASTTVASSTKAKRIVVDRSEQSLVAYEGERAVFQFTISTGLELTPTPRGTFTIFKKTPSRYMQGPLPWLVDQQYYDLPGVPWNMYFTEQGAVIHGAYWHNSFGAPYSHGCVNLKPSEAAILYQWADIGTSVIVQD